MSSPLDNNLNNVNFQNNCFEKDLNNNTKNSDPIDTLVESMEQIKERLLSNQTELLKNSILESSKSDLTNVFLKFLQNQIDPKKGIDRRKALASINLGYSSKETGYEGWTPEQVADLFSEIFEAINKHKSIFSDSISPKVTTSIQQLKDAQDKENLDIDARATWIMQQIQQLSPGESFTMEGGWVGLLNGHDLLYRFEKTGNTIFNIYIYDGVNGTESLKGKKEELGKTKLPPYILFENVEEQELFFSESNIYNSIFIKNLLSLNEHDLVDSSCGMKSVLHCFAHIQHRLKFKDHSLFLSAQQTGNCSVKAMNCLLLDLENDHKKYKNISLDLRLLTIVAFYHYFQMVPVDDKKQLELFMLKEAATNYLRVLDANVKKKDLDITQEQYTNASATIYHLLQNLNTVEASIKEAKKPDPLNETFDLSSETLKQLNRKNYASKLPDIFKIPPPSEQILSFGLSSTLGQKATWENLGDVLNQLGKSVDLLAKGEKNRELINQVEATMRNLSHLKKGLLSSSLDYNQILSLNQTLVNIQEKYNQAVFSLDDLASPSVLNTGMEFLGLSYRLSLAGDKNYGILVHFGLHADYFFDFARKDRLFTVLDPDLIKQRTELEKFFRELNTERLSLFHAENVFNSNTEQEREAKLNDIVKVSKEKKIFNFENVNFDQESFLEKKMADGDFLISYIDKHPTIRKEFAKQWQGEKIDRPEYLQAIKCFGSLDSFPPSLQHLEPLKKSAVFACQLSDIGRKKDSNYSRFYRSGSSLYIEIKNSEWNTYNYRNPDFYRSSQKDFLSSDKLNAYSRNSQSSHNIPELKAENTLLVEQGSLALNKGENDPNLPFYLALAEPDVQTSLLLNALEENLESLKDPHFRVMLKAMFMKVVEKERKMTSPFLEGLTEHQLTKMEKLLKIGKKVFIDSYPELHPELEEILFLVRLYAQGLQTVQSLHQINAFPPERIQCINETLALLEKLHSLPTVSEELKIEIKLAKCGLMVGTPLDQLSSSQQADLMLTVISLKNTIFSKSICSDYPFWRESKRKFFNLEKQWMAILQQEDKRNSFANAVLTQTLKMDFELKWELKNKQLIAQNAPGEVWTIDFTEPAITNSSGSLTEQYKDLGVNDSLKRLFQSHRYHQKVFGDETRFSDAKWGNVRVFGRQNKAIIQRQIENEWYTYIPHSNDEIIKNLKINDAIFYDHALWFNEKDPQDIRICDLKSGQEICKTVNGDFQHNQTKKKFYSLDKNPLLEKFEDRLQINGWIDQNENILDFNRYISEDGNLLSFKWDTHSNVWNYSINSNFHIDTNPNLKIDFEADAFLPLVSKDGMKRKLLIPSRLISSAGYSQIANVDKTIYPCDGQKKSKTFFEYDLTYDGHIVAETLDSKIYLAHLYLAQKRYQKALAVLKTIYTNDETSKKTVELLKNLIKSEKDVKDFSPKACAVRIQAFLLLHRISPFAKEKFPVKDIISIYEKYIAGQNDLEATLILDHQTELEFIQMLIDSRINNENIWNRKAVLNQSHSTLTTTIVDPEFKSPEKTLLSPRIYSGFLPQDKPSDEMNWIYDFFNDKSYRFLGQFKDFASHYNAVRKAGSFSSAITQGIFYENLTRQILRYPYNYAHDARLSVLLLAAHFPYYVPSLPAADASKETKLQWLNDFKTFYRNNRDNINNISNNSLYFKIPETTSNSTKHPLPAAPVPKQINLNGTFENPFSLRNQDQFISHLQNQFLEPVSDIPTPPTVFQKDSIEPIELHRSEKKYAKSIAERIEHYSGDCKKALAHEKNKKIFKNNADLDLLLKQIEEENKTALDREASLKKSIDTLANKSPFEFPNYVHHQAASLGQARPKLDLETVLRASAKKDGVGALVKLNSHLSEKEAAELQAACVEFMVESTHRHHLARISNSINKWQLSGNQSDFETAQEALDESRVYKIEPANLPLLLFEYTSQMRIRKKQADIIKLVISTLLESKNEKVTSSAFQLIMGGGKTSVIISMLVEMVSEAGMISCIMSHPSQLSSIKGSLSASHPKRFKKNVHVLDYTIKELSKPEILDYIINTLEDAKQNHFPVIMRTSLFQVIKLKFIIEALQSRKGTSREQEEVILKLQKILNIFHDSGVTFFDEGDINLSMLLDVNIPLGEQKNIRPERSDLIKKIFEILAQPELEQLLDFRKNKKIELSLKEYEEEVVDFAAEKIFEYSPLKLKQFPEYKNAFKRYVSGHIEDKDQELADDLTTDLTQLSEEKQENINFIRKLNEFSESSDDRYKKEAANLIAITRRVFDEILRISLHRSNNRNYGRKITDDDGEVIPYEGAQTPTKRQFGDVYLYLAYEYQSALEGGISKDEIQFLAGKMAEAANHYARKDRRPFDETLEAQQFLRLTSVKLQEISDPKNLEQAWKYINDPKHLERVLDVEAEVAPFHARYFTQKVKSNSINNVSLSNKSVTCSGTLWNSSTFHRRFGKATLDLVEGSIINLHSKKEHPDSIHEIDYPPLKCILNLIKNHPQKSRLRAIVDSGGFLKDHHTHEIAAELLKAFAEEKDHGGPQIDAILYLHKYTEEQVKKGFPKECFVLQKPGAFEPIQLKNTTKAEIERYVKTDNLFVIFDEMRVIGTDVELADNGIFLNTVSQIPMSTALQGSIRARKVFKDQENEFIVTAKGRKEMVNEGKDFDGLYLTFAKNEGKNIKDQVDRSRIAQIEDYVLSSIMKELREAKSVVEIGKIAGKNEEFLVTRYEDEPYRQYGRIVGRDNACKVLETNAKDLLDRFEKIQSPYFNSVKEEIDDLLNYYREVISDDETMDVRTKDDLGCTLEVEFNEEVQLELLNDQEIELDIEVLNELDRLNRLDGSYPYQEIPWNLNEKDPLSAQLLPNLLAFKDVQASSLCNFSYFPDHIKMTKNFYQTSTAELPLSHLYSKRAGFLLVTEMQPGKYDFIFISEKEATFFKDWIGKHGSQDVVLIDLNGVPEVHSQQLKLKMTQEELVKNLWYPHLFNGNIDYLENHEALSKELIKNNKDNISKYLQVKLAYNKRPLRKLFTTDLFDLKQTARGQAQFNGVIFGDRRKYIEDSYNLLRRLGQQEVEKLDPSKVEDLADGQISWLVEKEQILNVPVEKVQFIKKECRQYIEKVEALLELQDDDGLTDPQKLKIQNYFLKGFHETKLKTWHLRYLSALSCSKLKKVNLIRSIPLKYAASITQEQAGELTRNKAELIAKLNYPACLGIQQDMTDLLVENQLKQLDPKHPLDRTFIGKLDAKQASFLSNEALQFISPAILGQLEDKDIQRITDPDLLWELEDPKLSKITDKQKTILAHCYDGIKDSNEFDFIVKLNLIKDRHLQFMPSEKAALVMGAAIFTMKDRLWKHLNKKQVEDVCTKMGHRISQTFVEALNVQALEGLSKKFAGWLDDKQIQDLNQSHRHLIQELPSKRLSKLSDEAIQEIKPEQLKNISKDDFKRITKLALLMAPEAAGLVESLTLKQKNILITFVQKLKANSVPLHCLRFISFKQLWDLTDKDRIKKLPTEQLHLVKKEQLKNFEKSDFSQIFIEHLSDDAIKVLNKPIVCTLAKYLTKKHLNNLDASLISIIQQLTTEQLQYVKTPVLQKIGGWQTKTLSDPDLYRLSDPYLIQRLEPKQLSKLNDTAIQEIRSSQLKEIKETDFKRILKPELLMASEAEPYMKLLTDDQKKSLIPAVQKLNADKVPMHCLAFLSDIQVQALTDKNRIKNLPLDKVHLLERKQLRDFQPNDFSKDFIEHLSDDAIRVFNDPALCGLVQHLTENHLKNLDESLICIIQNLSKEQLHLLNDAAIQEIQSSQLTTILSDDFKRILKPTLLMAPEAAPYVDLLTDDQKNILIPLVQAMQPDLVPVHLLRLASDDQVKNLTDNTRIKNLSLDKVHLIGSKQLRTFDDFTKEFIERMNDEAITAFNLRCSGLSRYLTPQHLVNLDKAQINIIGQLSDKQLQHVKNDVIQVIFTEQVGSLLKEDLNRLTNEKLLLAIPRHRMSDLSKVTKDRLIKAISKVKDKTRLPLHLKPLATKPLWRS